MAGRFGDLPLPRMVLLISLGRPSAAVRFYDVILGLVLPCAEDLCPIDREQMLGTSPSMTKKRWRLSN
ncbi:hypothetical protein CO660_26385 [Rhizobium sp. L9]|nr:hypothetical protein CO660_26385 [Rhizobium sp. L9]